MTAFTPEEIKQARKEPRVGDRWEISDRGSCLYVGAIDPDGSIAGSILVVLDESVEVRGFHWYIGRFQSRTRNATLLKRGDA